MKPTHILINYEATIIIPALVQLFEVDVSLLSLLFLSSNLDFPEWEWKLCNDNKMHKHTHTIRTNSFIPILSLSTTKFSPILSFNGRCSIHLILPPHLENMYSLLPQYSDIIFEHERWNLLGGYLNIKLVYVCI